jgi:peptidoglycan hydrolase-like protein with peptidoglycan-binding domain
MVLAGKAACAGIAFLLLTMGTSGPSPMPSPQTLQDKGHYRGKVDGVFSLRTRASIRAYQKAENLPVTGQLDTQTAVKLGVTAEVRDEAGYETTQGKPSAGVKRPMDSARTRKTPWKAVKAGAVPERDRGDPEKKLQAANDSQQQ